MNPDLVCKIGVRTTSGTHYRGSGYPITPNCIITAAHVIADAAYKEDAALKGAARDITLTFGVEEKPLDTPVSIAWCDTAVDIAVLHCQLPAALQPAHAHELLTTPPETLTRWHAQGYTDFGKEKWLGGKEEYWGTQPTFSAKEATIALSCDVGLINPEQWAGGSGSVAFDTDTSRMALAVITSYQSGKTQDQLVAVPICYLLNSEATKDEFRRAINFDAYQQRDAYRDEVKNVVALKLKELGVKTLKRVVQEINAVTPREKSGINLQLDLEALADEAAMYIMSHTAVTDVVACLVSLMEDLEQKLSDKVADVMDYLLPLNYAPGVIQRLHAQLAANQLGLIENEVATRPLAEIVMAGYDQKPAKFAVFTDGDPDVRGRTALDCYDGPEVGPPYAGSESISVLQAVYNLLCDLHALQDTLVGTPYKPLPRHTTSIQSEGELHRMTQDIARQLRGELTSISKMQRNRTVYCVLPSLSEDALQRDFRTRVISEVRTHVPQLIFVELLPTPDERESEVRNYIRARVMRTQRIRKL